MVSNTILSKDVKPEEINKDHLTLIEETLNIPEVTKEELFSILEKVDPNTAKTRHPNDERRNRRSLEVCIIFIK